MKDRDLELWADIKEAQASMAISGFEMTDEQLEEVYTSAEKSLLRAALKNLKQRSIKTGENYGQLVDAYLDELDAKDVKNH